MRLAASAFLFAIAAAVLPGTAMAQAPIAEGQVWTFKDAPADTARVVIQKIEAWEGGGEAVHVTIYGLPQIHGVFDGAVQHMPFDRKALEGSLNTLTDEKPRTDIGIADGYRQWKSANGGIFTLSVAEALKAMIQAAFGRPHPSDDI